MKGSNGKKKRSKEAFLLKQKFKNKQLHQDYLLRKIKKWEKRGWNLTDLGIVIEKKTSKKNK